MPELEEHTLLVAVTIEAESRTKAHEALPFALPRPGTYAAGRRVESWWVAEDDRTDGSDCDSAVFVRPGTQVQAWEALLTHDLTERHNYPRGTYPTRFEAPERQSGDLTDADVIRAAALWFLHGATDVTEDDMARLRAALVVCVWCDGDRSDNTCFNGKDICTDCCHAAGGCCD